MPTKSEQRNRIDCVFIRRSGSSQETKAQQANVARMLETLGVSVPEEHWYVGTVGRRKVTRSDMHRALMALVESGSVGTVYVESQDRWGTADRPELFALIGKFRQHGTRLYDLKAGKDITADDMATELLTYINSVKSEQELKDLSYRSLRSRVNNFAATGSWPTGPAPYGYGKRCTAADGRLKWEWHPSSRTLGQVYNADANGVLTPGSTDVKIPRKEKSDRIQLVPHHDGRYVEAVRLAFELFTEQGLSRWGICKALNDAGRTYYGGQFKYSFVVSLLDNPAYAGHTHFGKTRTGELHTFDGNGGIVTATADGRSVRDVSERMVKEDTHEPLIDAKTWQRALDKRRSEGERKSYSPRNAKYFLKTLLVCGHCGKGMAGRTENGDKVKYVCSTYTAGRSNGHDSQCGYHAISHDDAERLLQDKMREMDAEFDTFNDDRAKAAMQDVLSKLDDDDDRAEAQWQAWINEGIDAFVQFVQDEYGPLANHRDVRAVRKAALHVLAGDDDGPLRVCDADIASLRKALLQAESRAAERARKQLEQARTEHAQYTAAWAKAEANEHRQGVLDTLLANTEGEIDRLVPLATPLRERLDALYADEKGRREERQRLVDDLPMMEMRERGEAYRRLFDTVTLHWDREWVTPKSKNRRTDRPGRWRYTLRTDRIGWKVTDSRLSGAW